MVNIIKSLNTRPDVTITYGRTYPPIPFFYTYVPIHTYPIHFPYICSHIEAFLLFLLHLSPFRNFYIQPLFPSVFHIQFQLLPAPVS